MADDIQSKKVSSCSFHYSLAFFVVLSVDSKYAYCIHISKSREEKICVLLQSDKLQTDLCYYIRWAAKHYTEIAMCYKNMSYLIFKKDANFFKLLETNHKCMKNTVKCLLRR